MKDPLLIINALRESDEYIKDIFLYGSCYRFYLFLNKLFPGAIPLISDRNGNDHIITRIKNKYYDIRGEVVDVNGFRELTKADHNRCGKWSFANQWALKIGECHVCEEPFCVAPEGKKSTKHIWQP